jgi:catechol-2,3-dioxygenase
MVAPSRFCHIVYRSHRFEEMVEWYIRVFEARVQHRTDKVCFLTYDDEHHRFAIINVDGPPQPDELGPGRVAHVAYAWKNLGELLENYKRLKDFCVLPVRPARHGLTLSMYYQDPDGNGLEFQIDLLDEDAASAYMKTEEFARNPSGESFNPDELLRRYEAGEPVDALIFRPGQEERLGKRYVRGKEQAPASLRVPA